jgi:hypothetical protein
VLVEMISPNAIHALETVEKVFDRSDEALT